MWLSRILAAGLSLVTVGRLPTRAEDACPPGVLGVSRVMEIDALNGPRFGAPSGDPNFLAPGEVVLTFDDGPMPKYTRQILAALAAQCTKATFFSVGEMAAAYPAALKEVASAGHTIGGHTWSHKNLARASDEHAREEIEQGFAALEHATGNPAAPFFRFPFLSESSFVIAYLKQHNIAMFAIDVDSQDWRIHSSSKLVEHVMAGLEHRHRGIILFHDIHASTVAALPTILSMLKDKGLKVVHLRPKATVQPIATSPAPRSNCLQGQARNRLSQCD